ncbi:phosphoenolpyruvate synthase, partial [Caerostris extrusa]
MSMFDILVKEKGGFDNDVYNDFAKLLSTTTNVESANVPASMQEVADQIVKDVGCEKFKSMTAEEALEWLKTTNQLSGCKFRQFLKRHGHRCIMEFDIRSTTWEMDPKLLVKLLQSLAGTSKESKKKSEESIEDILSQLNVPLSFISKWYLRFILPNCRRGVRAREYTKKQGYRRLGKLMLSEGRIPDEDLIFFLTLDEIYDLLSTRSPSIIS